MNLAPEDEILVIGWARAATPYRGSAFRSVELRHMHPEDALSGAGAPRIGGRFVPMGTRAIYAADSEETTFRELTARKHRLAGQAQFDLDGYPRIAYRVDIDIEHCVDLRSLLSQRVSAELVRRCLNPGDLRTSQTGRQVAVRRAGSGDSVSLCRRFRL